MKFNKWTIGLAAVGVVSLASAVKAEETANTVLTAISATTLSGYVDTSIQWNIGTGFNNPPYSFGGDTKADGFNLNVVQVTLDKPLDESEWASGYHVDLWFGPDANRLATSSIDADGVADFAIRQAYIALRTPIGNGIEWKLGVFDTIIGYESVAGPANPNYSRSWGQTIEPQTHTGLLASYRINDNLSVAAGIANTVGPTINNRAQFFGRAESYKAYMASLSVTAPDNFGFLAGSTMYAGIVNGLNESYGDTTTSFYAGTTIATPVTGLRLGGAFDYLDIRNDRFGPDQTSTAWAAAIYASYQATEKLSLHQRIDYLDDQAAFFYDEFGPLGATGFKVLSFTTDVQYDLWKNVLSRVEFRWDHADSGKLFGGDVTPSKKNNVMIAANIIYKF
jgi:hypothetical protein